MSQALTSFRSEADLIAMTLALGAAEAGGSMSTVELALARSVAGQSVDALQVADIRSRIMAGADPLGNAFSALRSPDTRREHGATYTPGHVRQGGVNSLMA